MASRVAGNDSSDARTRMELAAAELLISEGPGAITHRRVAEAAHVPRGSANYFFPTRDVLFAAAVRAAESYRLRAARDIAAAVAVEVRSAQDTARLLIEAWYAPRVGPDVVRARLHPMIDALHDPALRNVMADSRPQLLSVLADVLERSGYHRDVDIDLVALVLDGALLYEHRVGDGDDVRAAVGLVARLLQLMPRN